jgi:hypothetical protein
VDALPVRKPDERYESELAPLFSAKGTQAYGMLNDFKEGLKTVIASLDQVKANASSIKSALTPRDLKHVYSGNIGESAGGEYNFSFQGLSNALSSLHNQIEAMQNGAAGSVFFTLNRAGRETRICHDMTLQLDMNKLQQDAFSRPLLGNVQNALTALHTVEAVEEVHFGAKEKFSRRSPRQAGLTAADRRHLTRLLQERIYGSIENTPDTALNVKLSELDKQQLFGGFIADKKAVWRVKEDVSDALSRMTGEMTKLYVTLKEHGSESAWGNSLKGEQPLADLYGELLRGKDIIARYDGSAGHAEFDAARERLDRMAIPRLKAIMHAEEIKTLPAGPLGQFSPWNMESVAERAGKALNRLEALKDIACRAAAGEKGIVQEKDGGGAITQTPRSVLGANGGRKTQPPASASEPFKAREPSPMQRALLEALKEKSGGLYR